MVLKSRTQTSGGSITAFKLILQFLGLSGSLKGAQAFFFRGYFEIKLL